MEWALGAAVLALACLIGASLTVLPRWWVRRRVGALATAVTATEQLEAEAAMRTALVQSVSAFVLVAGAVFTVVQFTETQRATTEQIKLARTSQLSERFTRAVSQLGDENVEVRLGGIHSLAAIGRESSSDRSVVVAVLAAFARGRTQLVGETPADRRTLEVRLPDVQAAMMHVGRLHRPSDGQLNFSGVYLAHAELGGTRFPKAVLSNADLTGAYLAEADLSGADLNGAVLNDAVLDDATLVGAFLDSASLTNTFLFNADMRDANLHRARIIGAQMEGADLSGVEASDSEMTRSVLTDADLSGANFNSAKLSQVILQGADLRDSHLGLADLSGADLKGADLTGADLTDASIEGADLSGVVGADLRHAEGTPAAPP